MAELKTKESNLSIKEFLNKLGDENKKEDSIKILKLFEEITKLQPKIWGENIIGFGKYHYKSERSSQEGDWPLTGFSPKKQNISISIMEGFLDKKDLLNKLGPHKTGVSCLYIKSLDKIDNKILKEIIKKSFKNMSKKYKNR